MQKISQKSIFDLQSRFFSFEADFTVKNAVFMLEECQKFSRKHYFSDRTISAKHSKGQYLKLLEPDF